jgi:YVTN family beta-propeller protein
LVDISSSTVTTPVGLTGLPAAPVALAVTSDGKTLFVASKGSDEVTVIALTGPDANTVTDHIGVAPGPQAIAIR